MFCRLNSLIVSSVIARLDGTGTGVKEDNKGTSLISNSDADSSLVSLYASLEEELPLSESLVIAWIKLLTAVPTVSDNAVVAASRTSERRV